MLSGGDVKLPAVPGAGDDVSAEGTFAEWAAGVGADAVEYVEFAGDVVDGEDSAIGDDFASCSDGEFSGVDEWEPGHGRGSLR